MLKAEGEKERGKERGKRRVRERERKRERGKERERESRNTFFLLPSLCQISLLGSGIFICVCPEPDSQVRIFYLFGLARA